MTAWLERLHRVYVEGQACLATPREIDIQLRFVRGEEFQLQGDFEQVLDRYIPCTRKEIMRQKYLPRCQD